MVVVSNLTETTSRHNLFCKRAVISTTFFLQHSIGVFGWTSPIARLLRGLLEHGWDGRGAGIFERNGVWVGEGRGGYLCYGMRV